MSTIKNLASAAAIIACFVPAMASSRNIVISNDDGLTSNVVALYRALKAEGHDVIVSIPCQNQSGMGTALEVFRPLTPLTSDCRSRAAKAGKPGVGAVDRIGVDTKDFSYVDSTPVMSLLYGLDVLATKRWGKQPDLVLSGPNEGRNVGPTVINSGTISVAQYAGLKGIPAIALSGGTGTEDDQRLANLDSEKIASRTVELVGLLEKRSQGGTLLPKGVVLNVNFPDAVAGAEWRASRVGTYADHHMRFVEKVGGSGLGERRPNDASLPGITIVRDDEAPTPAQQDDEGVVARSAIAVTALQAGYEAHAASASWLRWLLND